MTNKFTKTLLAASILATAVSAESALAGKKNASSPERATPEQGQIRSSHPVFPMEREDSSQHSRNPEEGANTGSTLNPPTSTHLSTEEVIDASRNTTTAGVESASKAAANASRSEAEAQEIGKRSENLVKTAEEVHKSQETAEQVLKKSEETQQEALNTEAHKESAKEELRKVEEAAAKGDIEGAKAENKHVQEEVKATEESANKAQSSAQQAQNIASGKQPEPENKDQPQAQEEAKLEADRLAAEAKAKQAEAKAKAEQAEADKLAAEAKAKADAERLATKNKDIEDSIALSLKNGNVEEGFITLVEQDKELATKESDEKLSEAERNDIKETRSLIKTKLTQLAVGEASPNPTVVVSETIGEIKGLLVDRTSAIALAKAHSGVAAGNTDPESGVWLKVIGSKGRKSASKTNGANPGFRANSTGFAIGADTAMNEDFSLGLSYAFADSHVKYTSPVADSAKNGDKVALNTHIGSFYGVFNVADNVFFSGQLNAGFVKNVKITDKDLIRTYKGKTKGTLWGGNINIGYNVDLGDGAILTPNVGISHHNVKMKGTKTKSADNQTADFKGFKSARTAGTLGLGLQKVVDLNGAKVTPEIHVGYDRTFHSKNGSQVVMWNKTFKDALPTEKTKSDRNTFNAGARITAIALNKTEFSLGYDYTKRRKFTGHTGFVKARINF